MTSMDSRLLADALQNPERVLGAVVHDIRGPLHNMRGWTTLLRAGTLQATQAEHALTVVERQIEALATLADEIERAVESPARVEPEGSGGGDQSIQTASPPLPRPPGDLGGLAVMIVHHDRGELAILTGTLTGAGAVVHAMTSAHVALTALPRLRPDILLCGLQMTEMDGWTLVRQLRNWPPSQCGTIPAIALATNVDENDAARSRREGFQDYVPSHVDGAELIAAVTRLAG
jgi:CheY-like chemotaxis protein